MKRTRKIAKILFLASLGLLVLWYLVIHIIAPPYKYKSMYMFIVYDLGFGYKINESLSLFVAPPVQHLDVAGSPTPWYTGKSKAWFRNGNIAFEENYKSGKLHGKQKTFDGDGHLMHTRSYVDGYIHGISEVYSSAGDISRLGFQYKGHLLFVLHSPQTLLRDWDTTTSSLWKGHLYVTPAFSKLSRIPKYGISYYGSPYRFDPDLPPEGNLYHLAHDLSLAFDALKGRELKRYPDEPIGEQTILELLETRLAQIPMSVPIEEAETVFARTIKHDDTPIVSFLIDDEGREHPYVHIRPDRAYSYELLGILYYINGIARIERSESESN